MMGVYTKYGRCPNCDGVTHKHDADHIWWCNECDWNEEWEDDEDNYEDEMEEAYEQK